MAYAQRQSLMPGKPKRNRIYNPAGLSRWRRNQKLEANPDEERTWTLTCQECEHLGVITCSLSRLRSSNLICSECGVPIKRKER